MSFEKSIKSNPKSFWLFVKSKKSRSDIPSSMTFNGNSSSSAVGIANLFANFFMSNFETDVVSSDNTFSENVGFSIDFGSLTITENDVMRGITNLKISAKADCDGFSALFFKNKASAISQPLCYIYNLSLSAGIFINRQKVAHLTPVFKSGSRNDISNYRPISKLSTVSKLFEIIVKES